MARRQSLGLTCTRGRMAVDNGAKSPREEGGSPSEGAGTAEHPSTPHTPSRDTRDHRYDKGRSMGRGVSEAHACAREDVCQNTHSLWPLKRAKRRRSKPEPEARADPRCLAGAETGLTMGEEVGWDSSWAVS